MPRQSMRVAGEHWGSISWGRIARSRSLEIPLRLTIAVLMLDIETEWMLNALLTTSSSYRKCSKRRTLDHSAQATSLLRIAGTTKCSRIARGFGSGSISGFAAEVKPKAGFGFRASAAFPVSKPIAMLAFRAGIAPAEVQRLFPAHCNRQLS